MKKKCKNKDCDLFPYYGVAPHSHVGVTDKPESWLGSTRLERKEKWPKNFTEDLEVPGCGTYVCPDCGVEDLK